MPKIKSKGKKDNNLIKAALVSVSLVATIGGWFALGGGQSEGDNVKANTDDFDSEGTIQEVGQLTPMPAVVSASSLMGSDVYDDPYLYSSPDAYDSAKADDNEFIVAAASWTDAPESQDNIEPMIELPPAPTVVPTDQRQNFIVHEVSPLPTPPNTDQILAKVSQQLSLELSAIPPITQFGAFGTGVPGSSQQTGASLVSNLPVPSTVESLPKPKALPTLEPLSKIEPIKKNPIAVPTLAPIPTITSGQKKTISIPDLPSLPSRSDGDTSGGSSNLTIDLKPIPTVQVPKQNKPIKTGSSR